MTDHPRFLNAGNAGPFTLDGTRTYLVGERTVAVIDPGPDVPEHVRALVHAVESAEAVMIVLTHGHMDHAGCASALANEVDAEVWGPGGIEGVNRSLADGDTVGTDVAALVAVHTPGHTEDHLSFYAPELKALFVGDHLLGRGDTTWVAEYPGCVADYLGSLERLRSFEVEVIYPAHGPPLAEPSAALDRFEAHRRSRIEQVRAAMRSHPTAAGGELLEVVYGAEVPDRMRPAASRSLEALMDYVRSSVD